MGKSTLLAEFARRAAHDRGFLAAKRILAVDCRHTPPDEVRGRLTAVLEHVCPHPNLVVCLDGLHGLVLPDRRESNRPVLLAAMAHARCHLVSTLTPREFEDLAPDDPEFSEFFTLIHAPEPDTDTALRLMTHFARGLSERYKVPIEHEAVRQSVVLTTNYVLNDQLPAIRSRFDHPPRGLVERIEAAAEAAIHLSAERVQRLRKMIARCQAGRRASVKELRVRD